MGVPTKRPDDYFAQMAKTDDHMNKVIMQSRAFKKGKSLKI